jgi:hypothetical protein
VLYEGDRRDEQYARSRKGRKHPPLMLAAELLEGRPLLAKHLPTCDGWPPKITRRSNTVLLNLNAMFTAHGPLVLLRIALDPLDAVPLRSPEMGSLARDLLPAYLAALLLPDAPYACSIKRGVYGLTHCHLVTPEAFLAEPHASLVNAAPHGPGKGCDLLDSVAHGVVILDTPKDRQRVAVYISRHPDERLDTPGTLAYLDALEEELKHREELKLKVEGAVAAARLSWTRGVLSLRRAADCCF